MGDFLSTSHTKGWSGLLPLHLMGPAYSVLPTQNDHDRKSAGVDFDLVANLQRGKVVLTTRSTDGHCKDENDRNVDSIAVCYVHGEEQQDEKDIC